MATLINLGILLKDRGELKQANSLFSKAVELAPERADGHTNLGGLYARQGKKYKAIACYRTALELDPGSTDALTNLGIALRIIGQYVEAYELLTRAIEIDPNLAKAHEELAAVYREWGSVGKARAHLQRALEIDTENAVLRLKLATLLPVIAESAEQILEYRQRFAEKISNLTNDNISIENPAWDIERTNFYLAYHGLDDKPLQEAVARFLSITEFCRAALPRWHVGHYRTSTSIGIYLTLLSRPCHRLDLRPGLGGVSQKPLSDIPLHLRRRSG